MQIYLLASGWHKESGVSAFKDCRKVRCLTIPALVAPIRLLAAFCAAEILTTVDSTPALVLEKSLLFDLIDVEGVNH